MRGTQSPGRGKWWQMMQAWSSTNQLLRSIDRRLARLEKRLDTEPASEQVRFSDLDSARAGAALRGEKKPKPSRRPMNESQKSLLRRILRGGSS